MSFKKNYFKKYAWGSIALLLSFIVIIIMFVLITHEVLAEKEQNVDNRVFIFLSANVINSQMTRLMKVITYLASAPFLEIAYGVLVVAGLFLKKWNKAIEIAVIGSGGYIINYVMKLSFHRIRPPDPLIAPLHNFSFPSGHATAGFIFYGLIIYLVWKTNIPKYYKYTTGIILFLLALLIGFSRIYLRLHYFSDVIAGFCIGLAWLLFNIILFDKLKKRAAL